MKNGFPNPLSFQNFLYKPAGLAYMIFFNGKGILVLKTGDWIAFRCWNILSHYAILDGQRWLGKRAVSVAVLPVADGKTAQLRAQSSWAWDPVLHHEWSGVHICLQTGPLLPFSSPTSVACPKKGVQKQWLPYPFINCVKKLWFWFPSQASLSAVQDRAFSNQIGSG